jgi:hypothetical protein
MKEEGMHMILAVVELRQETQRARATTMQMDAYRRGSDPSSTASASDVE